MNTKDRFYEIDLLRILAALAVVLFHYGFRGYAADSLSPVAFPLLSPAARYGYLGVDLFFLISGFVILMSAQGRTVRQFTASRIARLYPAFWLCCTLSFLVMWQWGGAILPVTAPQYLANMTLVEGFSRFSNPIDGVYWSLVVEIKFYILIGILMLLSQLRRVEWFLAGWLALSAVFLRVDSWTIRFYLILDYAPLFVGGAMFFLIYKQGLSRGRMALIALSLVIGMAHALQRLGHAQKELHVTLNPVVVLGAYLFFYALFFAIAQRHTQRWGYRWFVAAGALTYPLYLLHQNIGYILLRHGAPLVQRHVLLAGIVLLMLAASWAIQVWVEKPLGLWMRRRLETAPPAAMIPGDAPPTIDHPGSGTSGRLAGHGAQVPE